MRRDILRKSKKWLKTLSINGFRTPYQILVDNSFLDIVNKNHLNYSTFKSLFRTEPKFFITTCCYKIHSEKKDKLEIKIKDFSGECEIIKCFHKEIDLECPKTFIKENNPNHFILATYNKETIENLKNNTTIPILRISKSIPQLDCCKMRTEAIVHMEREASKKELDRLKELFGSK